ncbi:MAG: choice-of-anchor D domain-containing protein, partial [Nodosilinea sp.]
KDTFKPPAFPNLVDRQPETTTVLAALQQLHSVECFSASGFGKSAFLRFLGNHPTVGDRFTEGILYFNARRGPLSDVWQALMDAFYDTAGSDTAEGRVQFTPLQIRRALKGKQALVLIDDLALPREEGETLLHDFPDLTFLLAATEQHLWGAEAIALPLAGLPLADALLLAERHLERTLAGSERKAMTSLCQHLQGNPLKILQAVGQVKQQRLAIAAFTQQVLAASSPEQVTLADCEKRPQTQQRLLALLALLGGQAASAALLAAATADATADAEISQTLAELQAAHWVLPDVEGYRLAENLIHPLRQTYPPSDWLPDLAPRLAAWLQAPGSSIEGVGPSADALIEVINLAAQAEQWPIVLDLAARLDAPLYQIGQWGRWEQVLQLQLQAAEATGNQVAAALALHQLGSRALCWGDALTAHDYLQQALALRETMGDRQGADWTRHNLAILYGTLDLDPDPPLEVWGVSPTASPSPGRGFQRGRYALWGAIAVPLLGAGIIAWLLRPTPAQITVTPEALQFPDAVVNTPVSATLTLGNTGRLPLQFSANDFTLVGEHSSDYRLSANGCLEVSPLPPDQDCTVTVEFLPQAVGDRSAQLVLQYAPDRQRQISLAGVSRPEPQPSLTVEPESLQFAPQDISTTSAAQTLELRNGGDAPFRFQPQDFALEGPQGREFVLVIEDFCANLGTDPSGQLVMAPGEECTLSVTFTPQGEGDRTATLTLTSDALDSPVQVDLIGEGQGVPRVTFTPTTLPFSPQTVGQATLSQTIDVISNGSSSLVIADIALNGQHPRDFQLDAQTCTGRPLDPQETCQITISFNPQAQGDRQAQLEIRSNAANSPHALVLVGQGRAAPILRPSPTPDPTPTSTPTPDPIPTARLVVTPNTMDFRYGTPDRNPQTLRLVHEGNGPLTIGRITLTGKNSELFVLSHQCEGGILADSGETCLVDVQFLPAVPYPPLTHVRSYVPVSSQIEIYSDSTSNLVTVELRGLY